MKGSTSLLVKEWLVQVMKTLPQVAIGPINGQVHAWPVPETFEYPFVTFMRENAVQTGPLGGPSTSAEFRYMVKVVDNVAHTERIEPVYDAIHAALDGAEGYLGLTYLTCECIGELTADFPPEDDRNYSQLGGMYNLFVSEG